MGKTCRCCLSGDGEEPIFRKMELGDSQEIMYSDMLTAITSKKILSTDGLPHQICYNCSRELKQAYKFRMKCDKAHETLMLLNASHRTPVVVVKQIASVPQEVDLEELVYNDVDYKDVKTIKIELDNHPDDGFMYIEPIDDYDDQQDDYNNQPNDLQLDFNNVKDDIKDETGTVTPEITNESKTRAQTTSVHSCPICSENFRFKSNLKNHLKRIHPEHKTESYFCEICEKTYANGRRHIRRCHKDEAKRYDCFLCTERFTSSQYRGAHMETHKVDGLIYCNDCPLRFRKPGAYYKHAMIHKEKKHLCEICSQAFVYKYGLTVHMRTHTKEKPYECPVCKEKFMTGNLRNYHLDKHTDIENLDEKTLAEYLDLKLQLSQKVRKTRQKKSKNICTYCGKKFSRSRDVQSHINRHLGIKPYYCELCKKHCYSEDRHKYFHKIKHVKSTCTICNKTVNTKSALNVHMRIHNNERLYSCTICQKSFVQIASLKLHIQRHNNEKNFICHFCSKAFITKYKLSIHIRSHTQERPFACDKCPKKFNTGNQLSTHKMRHEDAKTIPCHLCDKSFKTLNDRRTHLKTHERIRKHPCRLCDKVFFRSDHKQRHERTVHCMNSNELNASTSHE